MHCGRDGLPTVGALLLLGHPLLNAVPAEGVGAIQRCGLEQTKSTITFAELMSL